MNVYSLLNNDGYTIERLIHGETQHYNDIQMWRYSELPHIFSDNAWSTRVTTEAELEKALRDLENHQDKLRFIEVVIPDKMDAPEVLLRVAEDVAKQNGLCCN